MVRSDEASDTRTTQQYHLAHHKPYFYLPLTALQATKVNAALAGSRSPDVWLSPTQMQLKERIALRLREQPDALKTLTPDRSPAGIIRYAGQLQSALETGQ